MPVDPLVRMLAPCVAVGFDAERRAWCLAHPWTIVRPKSGRPVERPGVFWTVRSLWVYLELTAGSGACDVGVLLLRRADPTGLWRPAAPIAGPGRFVFAEGDRHRGHGLPFEFRNLPLPAAGEYFLRAAVLVRPGVFRLLNGVATSIMALDEESP